MEIYEAIKGRRSVRRYRKEPVSEEILLKIIDAGRFAPSAGNKQPWEFVMVNEKRLVEKIFENVVWLPAVGTPPAGRRPTAYIVVLGNPEIREHYQADLSAAIQNILLAAYAEGLGSCWIGSVNRGNIYRLLKIPHSLDIFSLISLGYPDEAVAYENSPSTGVWKDEEGKIYVPKKPIDKIVHKNYYSRG